MPIDWHKKGSPITAAVAALALVVGISSGIGGYLVSRAADRNVHTAKVEADRKVCLVQRDTNAAVRGLLEDFILNSKPPVTPAQKLQAEGIALKRFPVVTC